MHHDGGFSGALPAYHIRLRSVGDGAELGRLKVVLVGLALGVLTPICRNFLELLNLKHDALPTSALANLTRECGRRAGISRRQQCRICWIGRTPSRSWRRPE